jgi:hypothetical protein
VATHAEILRQLIIDYGSCQYWYGVFETQGQDGFAELEEDNTRRIQEEIDYLLNKLEGI